MTKPSGYPSPSVSLVPVVFLVGMLFFTIRIFGADALGGAGQICLLSAAALCACIGMVFYRISWSDIEHAIVNNVAGVSTALIILLIIGSLSATWMLSGVVPTLIYYGVQLIHPKFFLLSCCVICAAVSLMTGSSWTTIATIGIALMGIGKAQGFSDGWVAGAIISGAYFGDKVSPLSDTTVMASSVTDTPLFTHIRYMMITTVPSLLIALTVFGIAGWRHTPADAAVTALFTSGLAEHFHISLWLLAVPLLTGILIARKVPSVITLFLSVMMAVVCMFVFQTDILHELGGDVSQGGENLFKGLLLSLTGETALDAGNAALDELIATRGMEGMLDTVWLIVCAMCLGGTMTACGMLAGLAKAFMRFTHRLAGLVASTVGTGLFLNLATADQYISIILTGSMFKEIYRREGYESRLLSRTTEDAVTVTSVLIPWNSCALTQSTVLNVSTLAYLPYCVFNYVSPLMSILVASIGYKIVKPRQKTDGKLAQTAEKQYL